MAQAAIVIPARYHSTRLTGKILADIGGKSMIRHVYERAQRSKAAVVVVATDHNDIVDEVNSWDGQVVLTGNHVSGTDRVAEVAANLDVDIVINVQGDEPLIDPSDIDKVIDAVSQGAQIASLMTRISDEALLFDYNTVKVTTRADCQALYFSRQAIPAQRDRPYREWLAHSTYYQHVGLYGFAKEVLLSVSHLPKGRLEEAESLEQLRWLEHGYAIQMTEVAAASKGVDTQEDLDRVRSIIDLL